MHEFSLEEIYKHPVVSELIQDNQKLRSLLANKPEVKNLKDVPIPFTIQKHLLIKAGVHNGVFYPAQVLRMAVDQHEGLSLFLDHHPNDQGGTAQSWCGAIHNPVWSEADQAILADLDIVDPKTAIAIAYGAKFGVSATVDVNTVHGEDGKVVATDPIFKSYSIVLDPAVRETMLNSQNAESEEVDKMEQEELDVKSDLKPALAKLDDAIKRASAMKDNSLLVTLQQIKAILSKLAGSEYPYPKPGRMEDLEARVAALEQILTSSQPSLETSSSNEGLEAVKKENEKLKEQLAQIEREKLAALASDVLKKELELGLITASEVESRRKELEALDATAIAAVEQNLDKTIKILEEPDSKPAPVRSDRKELSASRSSSEAILRMMVEEQNKGVFRYGGELKK